MSVTLYMDVHVHKAITDGLRVRGVDVLTSQEDGTSEFEDPPLLKRAAALGRVLFTNDTDLLAIASSYQRDGTPFGGVIFAPQRSAVGRIINDLQLCVEACDPAEFRNTVTYLPF